MFCPINTISLALLLEAQFFFSSIKPEKYQAMKRCNKHGNYFISSLRQCSLLLVMLGLFLSSPLWLPRLCSSMKVFFVGSFPKILEIALGAKCLFLVFNLIIIFLVGESRLSSSSSRPDIYEEYVTCSQGPKGVSSNEDKGNGIALMNPLVEDKKEREEKRVEIEEEQEGEMIKEENDRVLEDEEGEEEKEEREDRGLSDEELKKRVEDFIARVNMQRRLEEKMLVCCG